MGRAGAGAPCVDRVGGARDLRLGPGGGEGRIRGPAGALLTVLYPVLYVPAPRVLAAGVCGHGRRCQVHLDIYLAPLTFLRLSTART